MSDGAREGLFRRNDDGVKNEREGRSIRGGVIPRRPRWFIVYWEIWPLPRSHGLTSFFLSFLMFDGLGHQAVKNAPSGFQTLDYLSTRANKSCNVRNIYSSFTRHRNYSKALKERKTNFLSKEHARWPADLGEQLGFRASRWTLLNAKSTHGKD